MNLHFIETESRRQLRSKTEFWSKSSPKWSPVGRRTSTALNWRQRGKNEYWIETGLQTEKKNSNGSQTELDAAWQIPWSPQGAFSILGTGRFYAENEYKTGGADVYGGGAGVSYAFSPRTTGQVNLLFLSGKTKGGDEKSGLSGLDVMAGLTFGL